MKAEGFINNHEQAISFTAENADDAFALGQISRTVPYAVHGLTVEGKMSLHVRVSDVVKKLVELPSHQED